MIQIPPQVTLMYIWSEAQYCLCVCVFLCAPFHLKLWRCNPSTYQTGASMHTAIRANEPSEFWCELPFSFQISKKHNGTRGHFTCCAQTAKILSTAVSEIMTLSLKVSPDLVVCSFLKNVSQNLWPRKWVSSWEVEQESWEERNQLKKQLRKWRGPLGRYFSFFPPNIS